MQRDTISKLSPLSVFLHWLVGLIVLGLLAVGIYMHETQAFWLYPWHKSFGVLIALFVVWRLYWRWLNGWPPSIGELTRLELMLKRAVHWLLLLGTLLMPVSGFMMSALGGHGVAVFGLTLVARNPHPDDPATVLAHHEQLAAIGQTLHELGGKLLVAGLVLHIAAAFKHHVVSKDGTLRRMLGAKI